jgi:hypothetical protein
VIDWDIDPTPLGIAMNRLIRLLFFCFALGYGALASAQATVMEIRGTAYMQVGSNPEEPLLTGQPVPAGAVVRTSPDSMVVLGFPDRQVCVIGEVSTFRIVEYRYDKTQPDQGRVSLNLINGSLRIAVGEIGTVNPGAIRVQIGVATLGVLPSNDNKRMDASVVVLGGPVSVTVQEGSAMVLSPSGQPQQLAAGQGMFLGSDGSVRRGSAGQMASLLGQSADGKEMLRQLASLQGAGDLIQQTVITLASLLPTDEVLSAPAFSTSATAGTAGTGSGGGGNIASPN